MTGDEAGAALAQKLKEYRETQLGLGLHFNLPMERYLADHGLGSGDVKQCAINPYAYWHKSWMNPFRPKEDSDTEARAIGKAMHMRVLEGAAAFDRVYVCGPNQEEMTTAEKTASTRKANTEAAAAGKVCLKKTAYERIILASGLISINPELAPAFTGGRSEVTFIWEHNGIRLKMRIDYLKYAQRGAHHVIAIGDLKSVGNDQGYDFLSQCYKAIKDWRYDVQAFHYVEGAKGIPQAIKESRVFHHREGPVSKGYAPFLEKLSKADRVGWQWVFHASTGAPETESIFLSPKNEYLRTGGDTARTGLARFKECSEEFGTGMWIKRVKPQEGEIERMPNSWGQRAHD